MSALSELRPVSEVSSEQRLRVRNILKRALEGELIALAVAPKAEEQAAEWRPQLDAPLLEALDTMQKIVLTEGSLSGLVGLNRR